MTDVSGLNREQTLARMDEINTELDRLTRFDKLTRQQEHQIIDFRDEWTELERHEAELHRDEQLNLIRSAASGGDPRYRVEAGAPSGRPYDESPGTVRSAALRAIDARRDAPDDARHRVATLLDDARGHELDTAARWTLTTISPAYERAVGKLFRDPEHGHREFDAEELAAFRDAKQLQRAMALSPDSAGGFLIPFTLDPAILLTSAGSVNPMRQLARTATTATDTWSGITSAGVTASWDAEAAEVSDDSPTLAQPVISVHKGAAFIAASIEVAADSNIATQVGALFTDAKDQLEATAMTLGTGTGEPKGIITAVSAVAGSVVTSAATALTIADIYAVQNALPARWRPRAQWMANLSVINMARQLVAGSGLTTSIVDDAANPPRMLGWALNENSVMDGTITATANDYLLLAGDFQSGFCLVDRIGAVVEFIPHLFGAARRPTGQRGWYMHWRVGSDVLVADSFRLLNLSA
jgi:HK97 family phage major capsid protein